MATNFVKKRQTPHFRHCGIQKQNGISLSQCTLTAQMMPVYCVKFSPVTPELTESLVNVWYDTVKNWHISSNISGSTGPISAIFTPYESALRADDGSVAYFLICQMTLPWQPNNIAKMLSMPTDTTCIRCTSARKQIAISWSSCAR